MNTTTTHDLSDLRSGHDLLGPLFDEDDGGDCYPNDENEIDP